MVNVIINGIAVKVPEKTTILEAAEKAGVRIPTLCYMKDLNEIGACRICVVEVEGYERLFTACNNPVADGMVIRTNSKKAREARKINVELILSQHNTNCAVCVRNGNCTLQRVANDLNIHWIPFEKDLPKIARTDYHFPLIREYDKCIKCMRCIQICDNVQTTNIWDVMNTGSRTTVDVGGVYRLEDSNCVLCGQCITHCPVGALRERDDLDRVLTALEDPEIITVVQVAPAIRTAWGEGFGLKPGSKTGIKRFHPSQPKAGQTSHSSVQLLPNDKFFTTSKGRMCQHRNPAGKQYALNGLFRTDINLGNMHPIDELTDRMFLCFCKPVFHHQIPDMRFSGVIQGQKILDFLFRKGKAKNSFQMIQPHPNFLHAKLMPCFHHLQDRSARRIKTVSENMVFSFLISAGKLHAG